MAVAMIQMYFKHLEMKMALTVAVNVCLVLHCNDYAKKEVINYSGPRLFIWKKGL